MNETDLQHLRTAIQIAVAAREHGNHPFGAILVDEFLPKVERAHAGVAPERDGAATVDDAAPRRCDERHPEPPRHRAFEAPYRDLRASAHGERFGGGA